MTEHRPINETSPLAERMRPISLAEFHGQKHLLSSGKLLHELIASGSMISLILWGPPGTGKTSLAQIISRSIGGHFVFFSAVLSGVKEIRSIVGDAENRLHIQGIKTVLFVDEIHRFNKGQQDAFLPHVESGLLTLIGATTENPSFQVIAPLLSRCRVLVLEPLTVHDLTSILLHALQDPSRGFGIHNLQFGTAALDLMAELADGDARRGLNILEAAAALTLRLNHDEQTDRIITVECVREAAQKKALRYDKSGEEHYNLISALHKSLRDSDPDGALYWFYRMIEAGEDPLYISRRLTRFASEDVGLADPHALVQANAGRSAYQALGSPEGLLNLAQVVIYLASAPKSNRLYQAANEIRTLIEKTGALPVPMHIRNAPTKLMKELGYGKNYQYAHDTEDALVSQSHLPPEIDKRIFYQPTNRGYESLIKERLEKWRAILKKRIP